VNAIGVVVRDVFTEQRPEHHPILLAAGVEWEAESQADVGLSFMDTENRDVRKRSEINVDE
jgi:hypothetical protein